MKNKSFFTKGVNIDNFEKQEGGLYGTEENSEKEPEYASGDCPDGIGNSDRSW